MKKTWGSKSPWYSSYGKSNYGELFYNLVRVYRPSKVVELGTEAGYSAYHIAKANLKEFFGIVTLKKRNAIGANKLYNEVVPHWIDKVRQFIINEKIRILKLYIMEIA